MLEKLVNVVIDWFKFSINTSFNRNNKIVIELFKILKLDIDIYDEETSTGQFEKRLVYDEQTIVLAKPRMDKNVKREGVDDYFFIDLSGQACRDFEQRGGIWKDLFLFISKQSFHCTRIDISIDDFGILDLEELKRKIGNKEYVSNFRMTAKQVYIPIVPEKDNMEDFLLPLIFEKSQKNKTKSYSATFGTKQSIELQFYDKYLERESKNIKVLLPKNQWIRIEMRFRLKKADVCFLQCLKALEKDEFNIFAKSLLLGLIEFKQEKDDIRSKDINYKNIRRYPMWNQYKKLIGEVEGLKIKNPVSIVPEDYRLKHLEDWLAKASANTLAMLLCLDSSSFLDKVQNFIVPYIEKGKFKNRQVAIVNAYRKKNNLPSISLENCNKLFEELLGIKLNKGLTIMKKL